MTNASLSRGYGKSFKEKNCKEKTDMRFKKWVVIMLSMAIVASQFVFSTSAAPDVTASSYGFSLDDSQFVTTWYTSVNKVKVYDSGILLGIGYQQVGIARQKNDMKKQNILVRFMLCPEDTKSLSFYYHGINKNGIISIKLGDGQKYTDNAPDSSLVTYQDSCSFSLGGQVDSKGGFSGSLGIGASTSWSTDCFNIISKVTDSQKKITTTYAYNPSWNFISTAARKNLNKWCNSAHKEFAMVSYNNNTTSLPEFSITYTYEMWSARDARSVWDGNTWTVCAPDPAFSSSVTIRYTN